MLNSHSLPRERKFEATNRISMVLLVPWFKRNYRNFRKNTQDLTKKSFNLARNEPPRTYKLQLMHRHTILFPIRKEFPSAFSAPLPVQAARRSFAETFVWAGSGGVGTCGTGVHGVCSPRIEPRFLRFQRDSAVLEHEAGDAD